MRKFIFLSAFSLCLFVFGQENRDVEIFKEVIREQGQLAGLVLEEDKQEQAEFSLLVVRDMNNKLMLNDEITITEGTKIQIFLPAQGKDFLFVEKKAGIGGKLLGEIADITYSAAGAVSMGSGNLNVIKNSLKVMKGASAVKYGADALEKINQLDISKNAKKIAGKIFVVENWDYDGESYILNGKIGNKRYEIYLEGAYYTGEIRF